MNSEDFKKAGDLIRRFRSCEIGGLSDEELALVIRVQRLVLDFMLARGRGWDLASVPLAQELELEWKSYRFVKADKHR